MSCLYYNVLFVLPFGGLILGPEVRFGNRRATDGATGIVHSPITLQIVIQ
jgi:hypothetical protein